MLKGLMTRLVLITALLVLGLAGPASAKLTVGIGEQNALMFTDGRWKALKAPDVRYVMPWDAIERNDGDLAVLDNYMALRAPDQRARAAQLRSLHATRTGAQDAEPAPVHPRVPQVPAPLPRGQDLQTWNEGNHGTQPTFTKPGRAALLYNSMRRTCPECTITAPSVLDAPNITPWIKAFQRKTRFPVRIWAIHNHIDANRHRTSGTRELLRITRGQAVVHRDRRDRQPLGRRPQDHAATTRRTRSGRSATCSSSPSINRKRITRIYMYSWIAPSERRPRWDSALVGPKGQTRPSLRTFQAQLRRLR